jgi:hypothetical protein
MLRIIAVSRSVPAYLAVLGALALLSYLLGPHAIIINLSAINPKNRLPYPELCAVVAAVVGAATLRPRFWEWDRLATKRTAVVSGVCAAIGAFAPTLIVAVGSITLPDEVAWGWAAANALLFSAGAFCLSPFIGPGAAGGATLVLYFMTGVANNIEPSVQVVLPVVPYPGPEGQWGAALLLGAVAVAVHVRTRGATAWSRRMFSSER